jgi:ribosomal protein L25 (general stress protein Ctc)
MKSVPLNAFPRTQAGRAGVKKLRTAGRIPAVIYGRQTRPQNLEVSAKELEDLIHHSVSENILVDLALDKAAPSVGSRSPASLLSMAACCTWIEVSETEKVTTAAA